MGAFSIWHLGLLALIALLLFGGGGKVSRIMGDIGKGITSFKAGLRDGEKPEAEAAPKSLAMGRVAEGVSIESEASHQNRS